MFCACLSLYCVRGVSEGDVLRVLFMLKLLFFIMRVSFFPPLSFGEFNHPPVFLFPVCRFQCLIIFILCLEVKCGAFVFRFSVWSWNQCFCFFLLCFPVCELNVMSVMFILRLNASFYLIFQGLTISFFGVLISFHRLRISDCTFYLFFIFQLFDDVFKSHVSTTFSGADVYHYYRCYFLS